MVTGNTRGPLFGPDPARMPWFLPLLTLSAYLLLRGYGYGNGDHDDFLPYLLRLLDPETLVSDWYVSTQMEAIGHRSGFVWLLYLPAKLLGPFATLAVLYVVCWCSVAAGIYALSYHVTSDRIVAAGSVVALLIFTRKFSLGSNDVISWQLVPSFAGWALALWGIVLHVRMRPLRAALLFGIAAWVQSLVGLHMAFVFGLMMVWERRPLRSILAYGGVFAVVSLIAIGPQVLQQWNASGTEPSLFHILFEFRAPHHYILSRFVFSSAMAFLGLFVVALLCIPALNKKQRIFPLRVLLIIGALCVVGFLGTDVFRSEFIGKLQLFRATVFAKIVLVIMICTAIGRILPEVVRRFLDPFFDRAHYTFAGTLAVAAALAIASPDVLGFAPPAVTSGSPAKERVMAWARTETARESMFAVPPSWESFRSRAQRSIVVSFKAVPFTAEHNLEWYRRLRTVAPIEVSGTESAKIVLERLDAAFFALPAEEVRRIGLQYGVNYVVRRGPLDPVPPGFEETFVAGDLVTYRVTDL